MFMFREFGPRKPIQYVFHPFGILPQLLVISAIQAVLPIGCCCYMSLVSFLVACVGFLHMDRCVGRGFRFAVSVVCLFWFVADAFLIVSAVLALACWL